MVRFNDKKQATELSPEDILIMTDVSDSDSDKKVTMNQMANYVAGIVPSNLPSQAGHAGQYLKTDGTVPSWADVQSLPSQTGQAGKYLYSDGTDATWADVPTNTGLELCDIGMALYVDETKGLRRYLNGQIVDINTNTQAFLNRLQQITTLHPSLLCTEEEWQTAKTMSAFGQVGKFVFNYSGEDIVSVRLPRVVNVQGLFDLQNLGMTVSAGLPDHLHNVSRSADISNANVPNETSGSDTISNYNGAKAKTTSKASLSNPIYGNSNTVQPEAIQYPYFIQIATGSETENNIINEIELNNPYSLFDSKYSDHELNNLSWLKSEGQWNAKAVYTDAYDKLLKVYNGTETVEGLSVVKQNVSYKWKTVLPNDNYSVWTKRRNVKVGDIVFGYNPRVIVGYIQSVNGDNITCTNSMDSTHTSFNFESISDYDVVDDYDFVLNTADETFRLPLKTKQKFYDDVAPVVGNGMAVGLTNGTINSGLTYGNANQGLLATVGAYNKNIGQNTSDSSQPYGSLQTIGITSDTSKSGLVADLSEATLYLYFYVGETVQNANLIDAGRIGEQLANKQDKCIHIIDTYINGTSGYRVWSDGYCEQWGRTVSSTVNSVGTINFVKSFKNTQYTFVKQYFGAYTSTWKGEYESIRSMTNSSVTTWFGVTNETYLWIACGYLADGQY